LPLWIIGSGQQWGVGGTACPPPQNIFYG
jgi:hypothetical protein